MQIKCAADNTERMINILDIYYIESVDKKTFVYLENAVYRTNESPFVCHRLLLLPLGVGLLFLHKTLSYGLYLVNSMYFLRQNVQTILHRIR